MVALGAVNVAMADPAHAAPSLTLDNDASGPLVTGAALAPGQQPPQCVQISYQSAVDGDEIGLFGALSSGGTGLENYLQVTIAEGTGGVYGDCSRFSGTVIFSGTLAAFIAAYGSSSTALPAASLSAGNGAVSYEFTFTLADDNAAQSKTAGAWFTWQEQPPAVPPASPSTSASPSPSPSPSPSASPSPSPSASPSPSVTANPTQGPTQTQTPPQTPTLGASLPPSVATFPTVRPTSPIAASGSLSSASGAPASSLRPTPSPTPSGKKGRETTVPVFDGDQPSPNKSFVDGVTRGITRVVHAVIHDAAPAAKGTAFSLSFLVLMVLFLLVHSRIDRRDPKLANAPLLPNFLHFERPTPGGAHDVT